MEVPAARRLRMLQRPKEDLRQATAFSRVSKFLSMPAEPAETTEEHRSDSRKSQELRALLKRCRNPEGLVTMLKNALCEGIRESSIFGAAMQTCGYRCWWMTLQKVRELQLQNAIKFDAVATSIGLTAITWNLRNEGLFDVLEERKEPALTMAKELWQEGVINAVVLTSALKLCTQLECPAAWQWGQQLWQETESGIEKNSIVYSAYITMLEKYGDFSEVDRLLDFDEHLSPVLLGALVDLAGHRHDPARADAIWKKMVVQKRVKPIESSYNAYARAYLVSGDPEMAIAKMEEMFVRRVGQFTWINAKDHAQALLILYHSMPTEDNKERLQRFLRSSQVIFSGGGQRMSAAPKTAVEEWQKLRAGAQDLLRRSSQESNVPNTPHMPHLHDILLTWRASCKSRMASGPNFAFAGDYLPHHLGLLKPLSARSGDRSDSRARGKGRGNGKGKGKGLGCLARLPRAHRPGSCWLRTTGSRDLPGANATGV